MGAPACEMRSGGKIEGMKKIDTGPLYRHLAGLYLNKIRQTVFSRHRKRDEDV